MNRYSTELMYETENYIINDCFVVRIIRYSPLMHMGYYRKAHFATLFQPTLLLRCQKVKKKENKKKRKVNRKTKKKNKKEKY